VQSCLHLFRLRLWDLELPLSHGFSGPIIFITDAHRSEGLAFRSASDEKFSAFAELESATQGQDEFS
jgi:hypothetical protein